MLAPTDFRHVTSNSRAQLVQHRMESTILNIDGDGRRGSGGGSGALICLFGIEEKFVIVPITN